MRRPKFLIVPMGNVLGPWIERLMRQLAEAFAAEVQLGRPISYPLSAFNPARKKFFCHTIIDFLREIAGEADFVLGLTDVELYSVHSNSVVSEVHLQARSAVIALGRLREFLMGERPEEVLFDRLYKEALRSIGHMLGLPPCPNPRCVMYPSRTPFETDLKQATFCPECLIKMRLRLGSIPLLREAA